MNSIRENDFIRVDLNLLTVLLVLHREGSVSRAAEKLHLGQPAVSGALARLRQMFNDPLFVRTARGMLPTPRAEALIASLSPMMEQMQQVLFQAPSFSPAQDRHLFRLGMSDWVENWLMPDLLARVASIAPGVNLQINATDPFQDSERVQADDVDVAISVGESSAAGLIRESVRQMRFCTLWHPGQLALSTPISIDQFVAHDHLLVSYRGASQSMLDAQLAVQGRERRVRYVTPHFSSLPLMLMQMPALATVPQGVADGWISHYGLSSSEVPVTLPAFNLSLLWHKRRDNDPALQWLLAQLRVVMGG
ncbi:LysR substrate-binding domain-containing protein [Erwiniaceae bacterium BAC15a-03b]|uniref:LysR substrate-binding domain-containing protein n=1 Tax=Winslowiella arboricola TaxID=2978220 RepID=A0A9J6PPP5_9GAMM|nr:LysR family transcriptional regulator [Winslowiella arboricola]MCU5775330.1 LysR substrate-binding domain-containing protein [Winslowiella arboricola]MCU5780273.1 LysR substrate-binding domain-containing protein [Winslowiella arboricola]